MRSIAKETSRETLLNTYIRTPAKISKTTLKTKGYVELKKLELQAVAFLIGCEIDLVCDNFSTHLKRKSITT